MADPQNGLARHGSTVQERDEELLKELGYKQELRRDWGLMHNFGISFSIIVCLRAELLFMCSTTNPMCSLLSPVSQRSSNMVSSLEALEVGLAPEARGY